MMTKFQRFLLEWLSKEDWSSYGECRGKDLDALIALGYVKTAYPNPDDFCGVALTEAGWKALRETERTA